MMMFIWYLVSPSHTSSFGVINQSFDRHKLDCSKENNEKEKKIAQERKLLIIYLLKFFFHIASSLTPVSSLLVCFTLLCDNLISVIAPYARPRLPILEIFG